MKLLFLGYFMMAFGEDVADEGATARFESPIFTAEASQCFNFFFSLHVSFKYNFAWYMSYSTMIKMESESKITYFALKMTVKSCLEFIFLYNPSMQ